jgi:hypothetical protein
MFRPGLISNPIFAMSLSVIHRFPPNTDPSSDFSEFGLQLPCCLGLQIGPVYFDFACTLLVFFVINLISYL